MNTDIEMHIQQNCPWAKLPQTSKQILGNSQKDYDKLVIQFSVKNQLRYRGNLVRYVRKDERGYYDELLRYSRERLMLYPYHLSDFVVTRMRITPFQYYTTMMQDLMEQEKSYDALPNFTAADCLRLLGIGRNQYIELMNQCRSSKKFFGVRRKPIRDLLPGKPIGSLNIEPWWLVQVGYVMEEDIKMVNESEKIIIDKIIDFGAQIAGTNDLKDVKGLYRKGLVYLDVPIEDDDYIIVLPLKGFVMNRVLGDYFETLLYKIFVSIDEHTTVTELSSVLQIDLPLVKNAVSMYCRLGFARKKGKDDALNIHSSWKIIENTLYGSDNEILKGFSMDSDQEQDHVSEPENTSSNSIIPEEQVPPVLASSASANRIGFLFDSTLTAFLMMGNLSPGLKSHAVTMFEVGKLADESLDTFLVELLKVANVGEGEARRYFDHALTLRDTICFLRYNPRVKTSSDSKNETNGIGLDLIRCESLQNLDQETCNRLLRKNYSLLISMAPLTNEIRPVSSCKPPHLGPPIAEVNSVWFKLFIYALTKSGPPSLLLAKGTRLRAIPRVFRDQEKLLITAWAHDPNTVPCSNALPTLNDALCHSAVLIQGQGAGGEIVHIPFPLDLDGNDACHDQLIDHEVVKILSKEIDLEHTCGYLTMMRSTDSAEFSSSSVTNYRKTTLSTSTCSSDCSDQIDDDFSANVTLDDSTNSNQNEEILTNWETCDDLETLPKCELKSDEYYESEWILLNCCFGIPLFESNLNKQVCRRIAKKKLCQQSNFKYLVSSSQRLCLQVLEFISKYQPVVSNDDGQNAFSTNRPGCDKFLPLPVENLLFFNGEICTWKGN